MSSSDWAYISNDLIYLSLFLFAISFFFYAFETAFAVRAEEKKSVLSFQHLRGIDI